MNASKSWSWNITFSFWSWLFRKIFWKNAELTWLKRTLELSPRINYSWSNVLEFRCSEKVRIFFDRFPLFIWQYLASHNYKWKMGQIFVTFPEYLNFKTFGRLFSEPTIVQIYSTRTKHGHPLVTIMSVRLWSLFFGGSKIPRIYHQQLNLLRFFWWFWNCSYFSKAEFTLESRHH